MIRSSDELENGCIPMHLSDGGDVSDVLVFCVIVAARKSSEWSAWYPDSNASASDGRIGYSEERYRCTCQAEVSHASQLRQPIIKKTRRICSDLHGCAAGFILCLYVTLLRS